LLSKEDCKAVSFGFAHVQMVAQANKVRGVVEAARARGLVSLVGEVPHPSKGYFVPPIIYRNVPQSDPVWREEIFGPVFAVRSFEDEEEAVALANDTDLGLVATIVAGDVERAEVLVSRIDAGQIWINSEQVIFPQSAWGGFKASGIGRELGPWGLHSFIGVKHLTIGGQG
jgi:betaine-aldehyde dehydrogenase